MTRYYLKQLSIEGFRGINNHGDPLVLKFKPGSVNSIHAPNGVGKSSIFEALHYAIYGFLPRLNELQDAEQGDSYLVNRFHPTSTSTIRIVFQADDGTADVDITVVRGPTGNRTVTSSSGTPNPESFLKSLQEDFVLVDYSRFAGFIDTSALERGRSFSSLVGLSAYSSMRQAIEGAKDTRTLNADFGILTLETEIAGDDRAQNDRARRALLAYTDITGEERASLEPQSDLEQGATNALAQIGPIADLVKTGNVLTLDYEKAEKAIETAEGGESRQNLLRANNSKAALDKLNIAAEDEAEFETIINGASERDLAVQKVGSADLLALLKDASGLLGTPAWPNLDKCPVCELPQTSSLKERLDAQIALYAAATELNVTLNQLIGASACIQKLGSLEAAPELKIPAEEHLRPKILQGIQEGSVSSDLLKRAKIRLKELDTQREETAKSMQDEIDRLEATLPPSLVAVSKIIAAAKIFRDELAAYNISADPLSGKKARLKKLLRWKTFIAKAAKLIADAETKLANERIAEIRTGYQELFANLVRGGPDVKPTLDRAEATEKVDLRLADFHGLPGLSARALLSESYRNAVAAAIFLTAAVNFSRPPRFMVLDDITSSFDGGHQFALMEALRLKLQQPANTDGIQFVVLSHDTALEKYFDKLNGTPDWHHQKLQGMPPKGRLMVNSQDGERLRTQAETHLNAGQIDIGAPFVRQYLEYKLGHIITRLQIPVPPDYATRADRRTLSTYLDAITNAVDLYGRAGVCVLSAQQIQDLRNTHVPSMVANFVSHYETGAGTPFTAYALLGVLSCIDDLADCFMYTDTGTPPAKRLYKRLDQRS